MLCMQLRSKKQLPKMTRTTSQSAATSNAAGASDTTTNLPVSQGSIPSSSTGANPAQISSHVHTVACGQFWV